MSTSTYYNFISSPVDPNKRVIPQPPSHLRTTQEMNQMDQRRQTAVSPASLATSTSNSSSSLNSQFNSLIPSSTTLSLTTYSSSASSASSSSSSSTASTTNLVTTIPSNHAQPPTAPSATALAIARSSVSHQQRDLLRQSSMTPTGMFRQHPPSQLIHSYTLHSLEPKPLKPFKSRSAYIDAMKEDLAEWLNSIYSDLELTPENFFSQLETGAIICRHANNVTQMGRNLMVEQSTTPNSDSSDSETNSFTAQNSLSSPSPEHNEPPQHHQTQQSFQQTNNFNHNRHRRSTANSSLSSISTTMSSPPSRQRLSLTGCISPMGSPRASDRVIDWFRVKVISYKNDAKPGTFFARDNICQFILWCRSLNILECLLFETDDLVARKNEKSFILCLLEVARIGFKVGMPTPLIIQLEQEIDREIENDAKLQKRLEEERENAKLSVAATRQEEEKRDHLLASYLSNDNDHHYGDSDDSNNKGGAADGLATSVKQPELNNNNNEESNQAAALLEVVSSDQEADTKMGVVAGVDQDKEEDEFCPEDFGPKPQRITNDLLSLHERVVQLLCQCTCATQFPMVRIGDGKYKVGDKLIIFVRILRRHIMVRVGGGWQELSEFLRQKDPCRTKLHQSYFNQQHPNGSAHLYGSSNRLATTPTQQQLPQHTHHHNHQITASTCHIPVSRSRLVGSSHHLNKSYHQHYKGSSASSNGGHRLISGSASMSWLTHN